jgi:glucose/arabinose dehydrogenase
MTMRWRRSAVLLVSILALPAGMVGGATPAWGQACDPIVIRRLLPDSSATSAPVDIRNAGDDRLFIVEQDGRILIYKNGRLLATPFLDITLKVAYGGERGLLSLAFHPSYPEKPYFFVYYTNEEAAVGNLGDVVIARYTVSADRDVANPDSAAILRVIPHASQDNHNGGALQFGPNDGYLYVTVGDGGGSCDNSDLGCNAQRDNLLLGKLLRLDVDQNENTPPYYGIPPTNPHVGPGDPLDEIWAKGLRNPFRFSFDRQTGDLWIGDVGQGSREEVDFQPASSPGGENYGWRYMEGSLCGTCGSICSGLPAIPCVGGGLTLPIHDYPRNIGSIIIGGYVYRGPRIPELVGCYVFGDLGSGTVWALDPTPPATRRTLLSGQFLTTFGEDMFGDLYMAVSGDIYRLDPEGPYVAPDLLFQDGFE